MSGKGALISPGLTARVHWALGAASQANPERAVMLGADLVAAIQQELRDTYEAGIEVARTTQREIHFAEGGGGIAAPGPATGGNGGRILDAGLIIGHTPASEYGEGGAIT